MLASVLAELGRHRLTRDSLMTEKLTRRGLRVQGDYQADVLQNTVVADVMTRTVHVVAASATVEEGRRLLAAGDHEALPVVDDTGRCIAMVTQRDLLDSQLDRTSPVTDIAASDVVAVAPGDSVLEALHCLLEEHRTHLPVVDSEQLVGICTRTDILAARLRQFQTEHLQPGWQPLSTYLATGTRSWYPWTIDRQSAVRIDEVWKGDSNRASLSACRQRNLGNRSPLGGDQPAAGRRSLSFSRGRARSRPIDPVRIGAGRLRRQRAGQ